MAKPYVQCYECGHVYRTAGALRSAYRRELARIYGMTRWRRVWLLFRAYDASRITFCQECMHDFCCRGVRG